MSERRLVRGQTPRGLPQTMWAVLNDGHVELYNEGATVPVLSVSEDTPGMRRLVQIAAGERTVRLSQSCYQPQAHGFGLWTVEDVDWLFRRSSLAGSCR